MFEDFNYCFEKFKKNQYLETKAIKDIKSQYWEVYWLKIKTWSKWEVTLIYSWLHVNVLKFVFDNFFVKEFQQKYTQSQFDWFRKKLWRVTNLYRLNLLLSAYFHNIKLWLTSEWEKIVINSKDIKIWSLRIEIARKLTEFWIKWKKEIIDIYSIEDFYKKYKFSI